MSDQAIIIGSGFAGLSAASFMARAGWKVTVVEKNEGPGGRARQLKNGGFIFDMGPSWYWMPDVFERYFNAFGKTANDYYKLTRLDPSYRVYWEDAYTDIPAGVESLKELFESIEAGSGTRLDKYLREAQYKYNVSLSDLIFRPGLSYAEYLDPRIFRAAFKLDLFTSMKKHIRKHFSNPRLQQLMEFPILFLGALPANTPALYSLMNYADMVGGTWYPEGGMYSVVNGMYKLALELGVKFHFNEEVTQISVENEAAHSVVTKNNRYYATVVISGADYHFTEMNLLQEAYQSYSRNYWSRRTLAPSCLLYYIGLDKKLKNTLHHSLYFDVPFNSHAKEIYADPKWPVAPLFYVNAPSVTDQTVAPPGCENLVILVPVAAGLEGDDEECREKYFSMIMKRMEALTGQRIADSVVFKKTYSVTDFVSDYNSFKGNAYGLANTLRQTAVLKPRCRSRKVKNLFYTGQLTVPGPGVPPCLISGEVVANQVLKSYK